MSGVTRSLSATMRRNTSKLGPSDFESWVPRSDPSTNNVRTSTEARPFALKVGSPNCRYFFISAGDLLFNLGSQVKWSCVQSPIHILCVPAEACGDRSTPVSDVWNPRELEVNVKKDFVSFWNNLDASCYFILAFQLLVLLLFGAVLIKGQTHEGTTGHLSSTGNLLMLEVYTKTNIKPCLKLPRRDRYLDPLDRNNTLKHGLHIYLRHIAEFSLLRTEPLDETASWDASWSIPRCSAPLIKCLEASFHYCVS